MSSMVQPWAAVLCNPETRVMKIPACDMSLYCIGTLYNRTNELPKPWRETVLSLRLSMVCYKHFRPYEKSRLFVASSRVSSYLQYPSFRVLLFCDRVSGSNKTLRREVKLYKLYFSWNLFFRTSTYQLWFSILLCLLHKNLSFKGLIHNFLNLLITAHFEPIITCMNSLY